MSLRKTLWRTYKTAADVVGTRRIAQQPPFGFVLGRLGYLARRFVFGSTQGIVAIHGHKMRLGPFSVLHSPEFLNETYEEGTTREFCRLVRRGATVVDVGAHIGYYTLLAARLVGESGAVYAFEPDPMNYSVLLHNISLNGYKNVAAIQKAVSDRTGWVQLFLSDQNDGMHSLYPRGCSSGQTVSVEATTLDDFFERAGWPPVDFVKMDIEGAELSALEGMGRLIQRNRHLALIVESNPERLRASGAGPGALLDKLASLGFAVQVIDEKRGLRPLNRSELLSHVGGGQYLNLLCNREKP